MITLVYGLDFTSAPRKRKPITCAQCTFDGTVLRLESSDTFDDFETFDEFLKYPGPWIAGIDFPFGQPRALVEEKGWGNTWEEYVGAVAGTDKVAKDKFECELKAFREDPVRETGQKQPLRQTDRCAASRSPMMLYGVPVGKMFFQGAQRLLKSGVQVVPCRMNGDSRVVVEAYPKLVAQKWADASYKSDAKRKQTPERRKARHKIVECLRRECKDEYGFDIDLDDTLARQLSEDASGDTLDALLSSVQAAWASTQPNYGVPTDCDRLEGWIADPAMITSWEKSKCQGKQ